MIHSRTLPATLSAGLLLLAATTVAVAEDAPTVWLVPNSPGWITVNWKYLGEEEADGFLVQREEPAFTWVYEIPEGTYTDKDLQADTVYRYSVCAVFGGTKECSEWQSARTHPKEPPRADHPKPPPTMLKYESYHEPSRIRIWWKKTGSYDRVIVRWHHKTSAGARQEDIDTSAGEGTYDLHTPDPGTYFVRLKGCTLNFVNASNCGEWSAPFPLETATLGAARVDCIPGALKSGSPRFEASGRAQYDFENPPPGYNTAAGFCQGSEPGIPATYTVQGVWNPAAKPGAWDKSDANTMETFTFRLWPDFSPERAPRQPDVHDSSVTITFLARAHCDRDPWLHANAGCRRTGDNVPQDIRQKWPTLLSEAFPHTRNAIPAADRGPLLARYNQVAGQLVGTAKSPTDPKVLAPVIPRSAQTIQAQASPTGATATATAHATRARGQGQSAQAQPQPLPPKTTLIKPKEKTVLHAPATQTRSADVSRGATPLQQSPLSKLTPEQAAQAEGKELVELRCHGGDSFALNRYDIGDTSDRLKARNQASPDLYMLAFVPPKKDADGKSPQVSEDGGNLDSSQCAIANREHGGTDPVGIIFDAAEDREVLSALKDDTRYWSFTAYDTKYGAFRAVRHGLWTPAGAATKAAAAGPEGGIPANLFDQDDRAIIVVGGKQTTAGKLKTELRAEMKKAGGAPKAVRTANRSPDLQIAGTAAATRSGVSGKHLAPAVASQAAIQQTQVATTRSDGKLFNPSQGQTIAGTAAANIGRASALQADCASQVPRIVNVSSAIKPGENFTVEGSCFGRDPGRVELIGLPTGKVTTPFTTWSEGSIAAMMPPVRGVQDQRLTMTIIRKADAKTSPPREVGFVAAKADVAVPAERWSPSARFRKAQISDEMHERDFMGDKTDEYGDGRMPPGYTQMRVQVNPACWLTGMGTTPDSGYIHQIRGWENGPPHQADVTLEWSPGCTRRIERSRMSGDEWVTYVCEIDFTVNATAHCPVGISP